MIQPYIYKDKIGRSGIPNLRFMRGIEKNRVVGIRATSENRHNVESNGKARVGFELTVRGCNPLALPALANGPFSSLCLSVFRTKIFPSNSFFHPTLTKLSPAPEAPWS